MVASHSPRLLPPAAIRGDKLLQRRMPDHFFVGAEVAGMQVSGTVGEAKEEKHGAGAMVGLDERHPRAFHLKRLVDRSGADAGSGNAQSGGHQIRCHLAEVGDRGRRLLRSGSL